MRVVGRQQAGEGEGLGRGQLGVVAVEVEALRGRPRAHAAGRAELERAIFYCDALRAVGVVERGCEDDERVGPRPRLPEREGPQDLEQRLLARDLARVDARDDEHARFFCCPDRLGRRVGRAPDDEREVAALRALPERRAVQGRAVRECGEGVEKGSHIGTARRISVLGRLGARERPARGRAAREDECQEQNDGARHSASPSGSAPPERASVRLKANAMPSTTPHCTRHEAAL